VTVGETVMALGYPSVAADTVVTSSTIENGQLRENTDVVPLPFVSEGIVALVSPHARTENGVTLVGLMGDIIQMSIITRPAPAIAAVPSSIRLGRS
jgi:hypothetical protein